MKKKAIALGNFDGLHRGHMAVIDETLRLASENDFEPRILLFKEHPQKVLTGKAPPALLTESVRARLLREKGIVPEIIDFRLVSGLSPETFFKEILMQQLSAGALCCGENYTFGAKKAGAAAHLKALCEAEGISARIVPMKTENGEDISATRIRTLLQNGEVEQANALLGRCFSYDFEVVHGDGRGGKVFGFPTVNQFFTSEFVKPKLGVYASRVFADGRYRAAVTNFGVRPTVGGSTLRSETCILDYSGDLYGTFLEVELLSYLRGEIKFPSFEALKSQIGQDSQKAQKIFQRTLA